MLSNANDNIARLHNLGYAIREEALSLQYTAGYKGEMEDGAEDILIIFVIKVANGIT